jgi:hypothetical protein
VASLSSRESIIESLQRLHSFKCNAVDDPYFAMIELARHPHGFAAVILSLASVYREELSLISAVKRRLPKVEIWLAHTDTRQAMLVEAIRLGADGLLADDGLHRVAPPGTTVEPLVDRRPAAVDWAPAVEPVEPADSQFVESLPGEPVLTADELRALLQDQPSMPPSGAADHTQG